MKKAFLTILTMVFALSAFIPFVTAQAKDEIKNTDPTKYYILLDLNNQIMTVFGKDDGGAYKKIVRRMLVSTGKTKVDEELALLHPDDPDYIATPTPRGIWKTGGHERFGKFPEFGGTWARYWTHIVAGVYMHSVMFSSNSTNTLQSGAYRNIGNNKSHGCVRMYVEDAKWVYDNVPAGTTINISDTEKRNSKLKRALKSKLSFADYKKLQKKIYNPKELPNDKATVIRNNTQLRTGNGQPTDHILARIKKGATVEVLLKSDPWCKIKYKNRVGYVLTSNLKVNGDIPVSGNDPDVTNFTSGDDANVLSETVRVYDKASTKGKVVCKIAKYTSVRVLDKSKGWVQVKFYNYTGYVQSQFVKKGWGIVYE